MTAALLLDVPHVIVAVLACVATPLALRVVVLPRLSRAALVSGALAAGSLLLDEGTAAAALVVPYAAVCALAGLVGVRRLLARWSEPGQLAMAAGLVALAGACAWLVCHRAGIALLGYPSLWVLLTAAHFHVAGCYLAIVVGHCADGRGWLAGLPAIGCVLGVPLTAAGIDGPHALEIAGALVMAASALGGALVVLTMSSPRPAVAILRLSSLPLAIGMVLAIAYALRDWGTAITIAGLDPLTSMVATHAILDTLFALLALAALARMPPAVREPPPLSRLRGAWPVGATYFARAGIERLDATPASGLVDRLEDLGMVTAPPAIRDFYEHTGAHELIVRPTWRRGFRAGSRVWAALARRLGQLQLPIAAESGREGIASRIVALDEAADGRRGPRAWIRTYPDGRALYVAAYATHERDRRAYMNIAFPLPGGQLSSVLRMIPHGDGVRVSTRLGDDCGIWLVVRGLPLRLPLSETIDVWTVDDPAAPPALRAWATGFTTIARHDLWLFGVHYLTLEYAMRRRL